MTTQNTSSGSVNETWTAQEVQHLPMIIREKGEARKIKYYGVLEKMSREQTLEEIQKEQTTAEGRGFP